MELERWFAENKYKERFCYIRQGHHSFFNVILCGVTLPNPAYDIAWDAGAPCWIFDYIRRGRGTVVCEDGTVIPLCAGDLLFYARGTKLRITADAGDPFEKVWIQTTGTLMRQLCKIYGMDGRIIVRPVDAEVPFERITSCLSRSTPATMASDLSACSAAVMSLTAALMCGEVFGGTAVESTASLPMRIRTMLDGALYTPLSLDDLSDALHLTPTHIIRVFRDAFGTTPKKYLASIRLSQAKILLQETEIPIHDIAEKLCYSDSRHFSTVFLRETGTTPSSWRAARRRD